MEEPIAPGAEAAKAKARDYFRTRCTEVPAQAIRDGVRDACDALAKFLATVPAAAVVRQPAPGEWSVQEVVDHLIETYRPGLDELRCLLAGQEPPGQPIPASLQSKAPLLRPWPWLLRELGVLHADVATTLASAPDDLALDTRAPIVMVVNVRQPGGGFTPIEWVEAIDWKAYAMVSWRLHPIDHLKQARAALAAVGA
jgi:hypothetical protein